MLLLLRSKKNVDGIRMKQKEKRKKQKTNTSTGKWLKKISKERRNKWKKDMEDIGI